MMVDKRCVFSKINSIYFNIARRSRIRCYRNDLGRKKILKKTRGKIFALNLMIRKKEKIYDKRFF